MQAYMFAYVMLVAGALAMNPCNTSSDYRPTAMFNSNQQCQVFADTFVSFTPSAATCNERVTWAGSTGSRFGYTLRLADKCCNSGPSVCADHHTKVCDNMMNFNASADPDVGGALCGDIATLSHVAPFTASSTTCAESISFGGSTLSRNQVMTMKMKPHCCKGTADVCESFRSSTPISRASVSAANPVLACALAAALTFYAAPPRM